MSGNDPANQSDFSRREFISAVGIVTGAVAFGEPLLARAAEPSGGNSISLALSVNGRQHHLSIDPRVTLLDLLREDLGLTGTKKGCDHGQCGACTVLVNGRRINSCLSLAATHDGDTVETVEGLAAHGQLHPAQTAFVRCDGFQCGYCTPGQICSAVALVEEARRGEASVVTEDLARLDPIELSEAEIRERMSGNICRCGAYPGIVAAIKETLA